MDVYLKVLSRAAWLLGLSEEAGPVLLLPYVFIHVLMGAVAGVVAWYLSWDVRRKLKVGVKAK